MQRLRLVCDAPEKEPLAAEENILTPRTSATKDDTVMAAAQEEESSVLVVDKEEDVAMSAAEEDTEEDKQFRLVLAAITSMEWARKAAPEVNPLLCDTLRRAADAVALAAGEGADDPDNVVAAALFFLRSFSTAGFGGGESARTSKYDRCFCEELRSFSMHPARSGYYISSTVCAMPMGLSPANALHRDLLTQFHNLPLAVRVALGAVRANKSVCLCASVDYPCACHDRSVLERFDELQKKVHALHDEWCRSVPLPGYDNGTHSVHERAGEIAMSMCMSYNHKHAKHVFPVTKLTPESLSRSEHPVPLIGNSEEASALRTLLGVLPKATEGRYKRRRQTLKRRVPPPPPLPSHPEVLAMAQRLLTPNL